MTTAYETTKRIEERRPSEDAASVGRWVIATTILATFLGFALFLGIAGAANFTLWRAFAFGLGGGGFVGFLVMATRLATYDKKPYVVIRETATTPIEFEEEDNMPTPMRGNAAVNTVVRSDHYVEHNGKSYEFSNAQMIAMLNRLDSGNRRLSRDAFGFGAAYDDIMTIMCGLDYWLVKANRQANGEAKRAATWKNEGIDWLKSRTRGVE